MWFQTWYAIQMVLFNMNITKDCLINTLLSKNIVQVNKSKLSRCNYEECSKTNYTMSGYIDTTGNTPKIN